MYLLIVVILFILFLVAHLRQINSHQKEIAAIANGEKQPIRFDTPEGPRYFVVELKKEQP